MQIMSEQKSTLFDGSYGLSVRVPGITFEEAREKVVSSFSAAGFGLPPGTTDLNMAGIFNKKFPGEFDLPQMQVIGFCSPPHALKALKAFSFSFVTPKLVEVFGTKTPSSTFVPYDVRDRKRTRAGRM